MTFRKFSAISVIALTISLGVALYGGNQSASAFKCHPSKCRGPQVFIDSLASGQAFNGSNSGHVGGRGSWAADSISVDLYNNSTSTAYPTIVFPINGSGLPRPAWGHVIPSSIPQGNYKVTVTANSTVGGKYPLTTYVDNITYDITAPTIAINGSNPVTVAQNSAYTDSGATATDNLDGNVTGSIVTTSNVNTSVAGTYSVSYKVTDSAGNTSIATRTVTVVGPTTSNTGSGANIVLASATTTDDTTTLGAKEDDKKVFEDQSFAVADIDQSNNSAKKTWLWIGAIIAAAITASVIYFKNKQTQTTGKKK